MPGGSLSHCRWKSWCCSPATPALLPATYWPQPAILAPAEAGCPPSPPIAVSERPAVRRADLRSGSSIGTAAGSIADVLVALCRRRPSRGSVCPTPILWKPARLAATTLGGACPQGIGSLAAHATPTSRDSNRLPCGIALRSSVFAASDDSHLTTTAREGPAGWRALALNARLAAGSRGAVPGGSLSHCRWKSWCCSPATPALLPATYWPQPAILAPAEAGCPPSPPIAVSERPAVRRADLRSGSSIGTATVYIADVLVALCRRRPSRGSVCPTPILWKPARLAATTLGGACLQGIGSLAAHSNADFTRQQPAPLRHCASQFDVRRI